MTSKISFDFLHENSKKAVFLLHGMTGSPFEMKKYGKFLFENGYDVYAYCIPGHGDSHISINDVKYQDWINFVEKNYQLLRPKYDEFYFSGLCLGAVLSLEIAQRHENITGVIALSTTLFLDGWRMPWYNFLTPIGLSTILRYYFEFLESDPYGIKNLQTRRIISKLLSKSDVALDSYPMSCVYELLKLSSFVRKNMYKVNVPVLLIHSLEDDLTSPKSSDFVFKSICSAQKEYYKLHDSYHMVLYDNEKEFVFNKTIEFMEKINQEQFEKNKETVCS